jgi:stringent starvation protein B
MSPPHPLPPKKEVALALLERSSVYVHLDPRQEGVTVPQWFKKQAQLVLQIGLNMPVPIPDLRLDDDGMSCTLSFNRAPFFCVVPWSSVFAMVGDDGRGMVWPDDVPSEVAMQAQGRVADVGPRKDGSPPKPAPAREASKGEATAKAKRPRKRAPLVAVEEGEAGPVASAADVPTEAHPEDPPPPSERAGEGLPSDTNGAGSVFVKPGADAKSRNAAGAPRKPKRELPPYLRIVK